MIVEPRIEEHLKEVQPAPHAALKEMEKAGAERNFPTRGLRPLTPLRRIAPAGATAEGAPRTQDPAKSPGVPS